MRLALITSLILFSPFGLTLPHQAAAENCVDYGHYLHWVGGMDEDGATIVDMAVSGNVAYLSTVRFGVRTFRILDITNPIAPVVLADIPWLSGRPTAVLASGSLVYVSDWVQSGSVLKVYNAADPSSPQLLGELALPTTIVNDMTLVGSTIYIADYNQSLQILNVADPSQPEFLGKVNTPGPAIRVVVQGAYAYVADDLGGLLIISVFEPTSPSIVSALDTPGNAMGVMISGSYAYVADGPRGLQIVDITNATSPVIVGNLTFSPVPVVDVAKLGPTVYALTTDWGLVEVDASNPSAPIPGVRRLARGTNVQVVGTMMFVNGIGYAQFDNPSWHSNQEFMDDVTFGSVEVEASFVLAKSGSIVYIATYATDYGITLADVSDPTSPVLMGSVVISDYPNDLAVSDSIAYVAANVGLLMLDVSDPQNPSIVGSQPDPDNWTGSIEIDGATGYLATYPEGLKVLDLTDPIHPTLVTTLGIPCQDVTLSGSWAYLACDDSILVLDVTDPNTPLVVGSVVLPTWINDIAVSGSMLYVADDTAGLQIVDASNSAAPVLVSGVPIKLQNIYAMSVAVVGSYAYLATVWQPSGLEVFDVSNPEAPTLVGNLNISGNFGVIASESLLYLVEAHNAPDGSYPAQLMVALPHCPLGVSGMPDEPKPFSPLLGVAYPNPALGGGSTIPFATSRRGLVSLRILDVAGREVRTLVNDILEEGNRRVVWDGRGNKGERVPAGIYFYQLRAPDFEATRKLVRIH